MQDQQNIEELFRESFKNFEEPVKPELWSQIADKIGTSAPTPSSDAPVHVVETVTTGSKITGTVATWISAAAITVSGIVGYYIYDSFQSPKAPSENHQPASQEVNNSEELISTINTSPSSTEINNKIESATSEKNSIVKTEATTSGPSKTNSGNEKNSASSQTGQLSVEVKEEKSVSENTKLENQSKDAQVGQTPKSNSPSAPSETEIQIPTPNIHPSIGYAPLEVSFSLSGDVQKAEWDFGSGITESKIAPFNHIFNDPGIYNITLKTTDIKGNIKSEVINIEVVEDMNIKGISNIFTPNYDGSNDQFTFNSGNLTDIEVTIYDKGGRLIYKFTDPEQGWDGKLSSGENAPEGTYFYVIFATGSGNKKHQQGGTIQLIR